MAKMDKLMNINSDSFICFLLVGILTLNGICGNSGYNDPNIAEPSFMGPIENVSAPLGREAALSCSVQNLGTYKVGWMRAADQTVLALQGRVVTHNARFSVSHEDMHVWKLRIRNLRETDRGCYICQINASPMRKQIGCIDVFVPPDISDEKSSSDVSVREGGDALMYCSANGHPVPRITWRREDGAYMVVNTKEGESKKLESHHGNLFNLYKVNRKQMGAYLCIASNDVPPAVSKRVYLNVNFIPTIKTPKNLLGGMENSEIDMECVIEAHPRPVSYWIKDSPVKGNGAIENYERTQMLVAGTKHRIVEERTSLYETRLMLKIRNFTRSDLGTYTCFSTNAHGSVNKTIRIHEIKIPTTTTTSTTTTTAAPTTTTVVTTTKVPLTTNRTTALEHTTELITTTTEYPTFYPMHGDPYAGEPQANQPYHDVIYSSGRKSRHCEGSLLIYGPLAVTFLIIFTNLSTR